MNTTAIPTLDYIPDAEKIYDCRNSIHKTNKRINVIGSDTATSHLNSNLAAGRTYSNCVTSSGVSPIPKLLTDSIDPVQDDISMEDRFYSDSDIIEEETAMDEVLLLLDSEVSPTDVPECVSVTVNYDEQVDEENTFVDEMAINCDNDAKVIVSRTDYVDLIETNDETDYEDDNECELMDENEMLFEQYSRKDLINELLAARSRIGELETKLANIQKAHVSMIQNLNNFNKVLVS